MKRLLTFHALVSSRLRNSDGAQRAEDGRSSYRASNVEQTATGEWCHRNLFTCTDKTFNLVDALPVSNVSNLTLVTDALEVIVPLWQMLE